MSFAADTANLTNMARERRKPTFAVLKGWHEEALRMYFMGFKHRHIAKTTGRTMSDIQQLFASEAGRRYLDALHEKNLTILAQAQTELELMVPRALEEMRRFINSEWEEYRFRAAKFILESQGFTPVRRVEIKRVRPGSEDDWSGKSEEELRAAALAALTVETTAERADEKHIGHVPEHAAADVCEEGAGEAPAGPESTECGPATGMAPDSGEN